MVGVDGVEGCGGEEGEEVRVWGDVCICMLTCFLCVWKQVFDTVEDFM